MIKYHPYHNGTNSVQEVILKRYLISSKVFWQIPNEKDDFVGRIKNWDRQLVKEANVVIAIAPGHEKVLHHQIISCIKT